jgi:pyridoxamine 5'-phosphate oxidase family protein
VGAGAGAGRDGGHRMNTFTEDELAFLAGQEIGRLATVGRTGLPHVVPVSFRLDPELHTIDVEGHEMAATLKFRHVQAHPLAAFVVDDIAPPWRLMSIEVRGAAEAIVTGGRGMIRIHPARIATRGLDGTPMLRTRRLVHDG